MSTEEHADHERVLHASKKPWLAVLLVCVVFAAVGVLTLPDPPFVAWGSIIFGGLGGLISIMALLPGRIYLRLTPEGYEQRLIFSTSKQPWRHIERFQAYRNRPSPGRFVGIIFDPDYKDHAALRRIARFLTGVDGALGDTFGMSADELAGLLNEWLNHYKRQ